MEFRIGGDLHPDVRLKIVSQAFFQFVVRADGNCGFDHNHTIPLNALCYLVHDLIYIGKIGGSVFLLRGSHSHEDHFRVLIGEL